MKWSAFIVPLLKAKLPIIALLGQVLILYFVFTSTKVHQHRIEELVIASTIFWIGYIFLWFTQKNEHDVSVRELELEFELKISVLEQDHNNVVSGLQSQVHLLQNKIEEHLNSTNKQR